jgi:hypothetical protein
MRPKPRPIALGGRAHLRRKEDVMTKTLFVLPAAEHSTLSCVWIDTGNPALPLACVWIDRDLHIAGTDANIGSEISEPQAPWKE